MGLVTMKEILESERRNRSAVASFTVWSIDSCTAAVEAAESEKRPVMIMSSGYELNQFGAEELASVMLTSAKKSKVPVAVHLDHGDSIETLKLVLRLGFTSVMIDGSHLPFEENVEITRKAVDEARKYGATIEGELGRISGAETDISVSDEDIVQTSPDEAKRFAEKTGVDTLAVSIGTVHGFFKSEPKLNIDRLKKISSLVSIPLVLHGGTGIPEKQIIQAIENGISKINIATEFIAAFAKSYKRGLSRDDFDFHAYSVYDIYKKGRGEALKLAIDRIKLLANRK